jgi:pimeloyl-ACP methyl ester carboxylesterase
MNSFLTTRDGLKLAYYVDDFTDPWTRPETLLLPYPAMANARRWFRWVPRLARRYRVVRMDMRGHGASDMPAPEQDLSLSQLVDDTLNLLDHIEERLLSAFAPTAP